jgi:hypothetical protein
VNIARAMRHVCRKCGFVVEPSPMAHTKMRRHVEREHGYTLPKDCTTHCGFRASPYEGRYTAEYHEKDETPGSAWRTARQMEQS